MLTGLLLGLVLPAAMPAATLDGLVGVEDLLAIIATWGNAGGPEDIDGSGMVGTGDLLIILDDWGWCE